MGLAWSWRDRALCGMIDPRIWGAIELSVEDMLETGQPRAKTRRAVELAMPALVLCQSCPVAAQCAAWGKEVGYTGVCAGKVLVKGKPVGLRRTTSV